MMLSVAGGEGFNGDDLEKELGMLIRDQRRQDAIDRERELNLFRSGSAPPTVEGSLAAVKSGLLAGGLPEHGGASNSNGFLSEDALRADPAYLDYYYSNVNLNPRLPPPVLSKEDWRFAQRFQMGNSAFGGIGDRRKGDIENDDDGGSSLFAQQPKFGSFHGDGDAEARKAAAAALGSAEWVDREGDGLIGLPGLALGSRQKSFAEILQDDLGHTVPIPSHPSRPTSRNAFNIGVETSSSDETQFVQTQHEISSGKGMQISEDGQNVAGIKSGRHTPRTFASVLSGTSRSSTPDPQLIKRTPSPSLPPVGVKIGSKDKKVNNGSSSFDSIPAHVSESADIVDGFSSLNISKKNLVVQGIQPQLLGKQEQKGLNNYPFDMRDGNVRVKKISSGKKSDWSRESLQSISQPADLPYFDLGRTFDVNQNNLYFSSDGHSFINSPVGSPSNSYLKYPNTAAINSPVNSPTMYQKNNNFNSLTSSYAQSGLYANSSLPQMLLNQVGSGCLPPLFENAARMSALGYPGLDTFDLGSISSGLTAEDLHKNAMAAGLQMPFIDPLYYMRAAEYATQAAPNYNDPLLERSYTGNAYMDALGLLNAQIGAMPLSDKQYAMMPFGNSESLNKGYYGNPNVGVTALAMSYPGASIGNQALSASIGPGSPNRHTEKNSRYAIGMRNASRGLMGSWHPDAGSNINDGFPFTLLDEFKTNKTRSFELSEIAGHVVEFSADQYGSRFIQQKLETASTDEKNMVFEEIMPHALSLMTDVFGNYVIQKFFEHGSASQIRELANQLIGHVLTLSLQMYGCRVIQKAIEVVELDQQTKMVAELDGHIMRCVRDQNGNHVIQKCIECIPQNAIQFIISSFYGQVVTLSTHPYGCRVIQRVLEHCDDPKTQQIVMDEIFQCVCMLAQDQYGNYVVQHILEHGKPDERSIIIRKLAGQIVLMSQQKFASNVVEKCLTFSGLEERKILVDEMLGSTDENEPLQAMMKDQFANYVVQKVLETCDDQQRELILSRIKVHLNALKKYTYGKHIVARVEKLVAAGERRLGISSASPSLIA